MRGCWIIAAALAVSGLTAGAQVPDVAPEGASSSGMVAPPGEPGQRLVVTGRVRSAESGDPVANASVYIYQTDAAGYYTPGATNDNRNPRLHVHLRTDRSGAFEAHTIRPGPYPQGRVPAHIHFVVQAPGHARRVFEIVFHDDPLVTERIRSQAQDPRSTFIVATPRSEGPAQRIEQDVLVYR